MGHSPGTAIVRRTVYACGQQPLIGAGGPLRAALAAAAPLTVPAPDEMCSRVRWASACLPACLQTNVSREPLFIANSQERRVVTLDSVWHLQSGALAPTLSKDARGSPPLQVCTWCLGCWCRVNICKTANCWHLWARRWAVDKMSTRACCQASVATPALPGPGGCSALCTG